MKKKQIIVLTVVLAVCAGAIGFAAAIKINSAEAKSCCANPKACCAEKASCCEAVSAKDCCAEPQAQDCCKVVADCCGETVNE